MKIVLSLPHALTSLFVVVTAERVPFDVSSVPWRVGAPQRKAAIRAIGSPALLVTQHPTPWRPDGTSLTAAERRLLRRSGQHVVVSTTAPPHELPGSVQLARATARALARECHGLLIDPLSGTTVPACARAEEEPVDFDLGDDWLGWDIHPHDTPTGAGDGLSVTSRGLRRFALPEITLEGATHAHRQCAIDLLRTVAHRLVTDQLAFVAAHPDTRQRAIDDHLRIEPSFLDDDGEASFAVRLTPCETGSRRTDDITRLKVGPEGDTDQVTHLKVSPVGGTGQATCLRVGPPSDCPGTLGDWLQAIHRPPRRASLTSIDRHGPEPSPALAA